MINAIIYSKDNGSIALVMPTGELLIETIVNPPQKTF
jgi:hypothetical protein